MSHLIVLVGIQGSGKSSWAEKEKQRCDIAVVSTDELRALLFGDVTDQSNNAQVFELAHKLVATYLEAGVDVIYDATNIKKEWRKPLIEIGKKYDAYIICIYFNIPIETCLDRNFKRNRKVPSDVIKRYHEMIEEPRCSEGFNDVIFTNGWGRPLREWEA